MMKHIVKKMIAWLCVAALMVTCIGGSMAFAAEGDPINLAANKNAIATHEQHVNVDCWADNATDGDTTTQWSTYGAVSGFSDANPQAIMIDLGAQATMTALNVYWFGDPTRTYTCNIYATDTPTIVVEDAVRGATGTFNKAGLMPNDTYTSKTSSGSGTNMNGTVLDEYTFATPLVGRYITIEVTACQGGNNANLWDLQVMGTFNGEVDANEIAAAEKPDAIEAPTGTALSDLQLPETVKIAPLNGEPENVPVTWSCDNYQANKAGDYVLVGTPDLSGTEYKNTNAVTSKMVVSLEDVNLALNKSVVATGEDTEVQGTITDQGKKNYAVDGNKGTRWIASGLPDAIQVDLGQTCDLSSLGIYWFMNKRIVTFDVYVTDDPIVTDGQPFVKPTDVTPVLSDQKGENGSGSGSAGSTGTIREEYIFDEGTKGRYVTVYVTANDTRDNAILWELEVMGSYAETAPETNPLGLAIDITEGAFDPDAASVTWNGEITWGADTSIDEINAAATFVEYGAIYGVNADVTESATVDNLTDGQTAKKFFATQTADESVEVHTIFGFRLKSIAPTVTERAAKFYLTYEYENEIYTVYSDVEAAILG